MQRQIRFVFQVESILNEEATDRLESLARNFGGFIWRPVMIPTRRSPHENIPCIVTEFEPAEHVDMHELTEAAFFLGVGSPDIEFTCDVNRNI